MSNKAVSNMIDVILASKIPLSLKIRLSEVAHSFSVDFKVSNLMRPWNTLTYEAPPINPMTKNKGQSILRDLKWKLYVLMNRNVNIIDWITVKIQILLI